MSGDKVKEAEYHNAKIEIYSCDHTFALNLWPELLLQEKRKEFSLTVKGQALLAVLLRTSSTQGLFTMCHIHCRSL